ncbi:MAG: amino acid permease [Bryobacteraceae bacterium]
MATAAPTGPAATPLSPVMKGHGFGTAPVFLAAISTILGAVMFLRFGYAVGHLGLTATIVLIILGHMVTVPTAMAVAEISTNRRVEGGGEYFMISRSFGTTIGGAIGVSLYLSQAVSVAFYMIAFAEAFRPMLDWIQSNVGIATDPRMVSVPFTILLVATIIYKGAELGVRALWVVCAILAVSLTLFFLGKGPGASPDGSIPMSAHIAEAHPFNLVFAIVFPAFTGMTAGVGLSGDLKNPRRSIPLGTLSATVVGMLVYICIAVKLAANVTPEQLASDQLIMSKIALWGPIIPIGLAAATISSALGSILIAPRTLQALARDRVLPSLRLNAILAHGRGKTNEPVHATIVSGTLALLFVAMGDVDFVAQIISMFFMVTYGAICSISFLEHFAGNPSYRPSFQSRWYVSLLGAFMCFMMMFQMQPLYAVLSLSLMAAMYQGLRHTRRGERNLTAIIQGVIFQLTRKLQIAVQKSRADSLSGDWRPSVIGFSRNKGGRLGQFDLLRWICHRHGFGEFIQYIEGRLSPDSELYSRAVAEKLIQRAEMSEAGIYVDTIISPSFETALAQVVQLPGISGLPNNTVLFEFTASNTDEFVEVQKGAQLVAPLGFNVCILRSSAARFGFRRNIHIWLTKNDFQNAPLMILLSYIIIGHPDWDKAEISIFVCFPESETEEGLSQLNNMITEGRLPISHKNVSAVPYSNEARLEDSMMALSGEADLTVLGLTMEELQGDGHRLLCSPNLKDVLFVLAMQKISIS